jgi:hypothetical protein
MQISLAQSGTLLKILLDEKLHPTCGMEFLGMEKKLQMPNTLDEIYPLTFS